MRKLYENFHIFHFKKNSFHDSRKYGNFLIYSTYINPPHYLLKKWVEKIETVGYNDVSVVLILLNLRVEVNLSFQFGVSFCWSYFFRSCHLCGRTKMGVGNMSRAVFMTQNLTIILPFWYMLSRSNSKSPKRLQL